MKHKINIGLAFMAIIILILVQAYVINKLYDLENKEFDRSYVQEVYLALELFQNEKGQQPYDSILISLNNYSEEILFQISEYELEKDSIKNKVLDGAINTMANCVSLPAYLSSYLKDKNLESDFISGFKIKQYSLINFGNYIPIIETPSNDEENKESTFNEIVTAEYNYCNITFDFYIDFTHKRQVILREMRVILLLMFFTISIVLIVYLLTVNNLLKQKKLSELKSDFINNMTHELKTPLSTISVASSGLHLNEGNTGNKKTTELTGIIKRQIKLLNKMIDQILDISMLEKAGFLVKKETFEIVSFMEDLLEDFKLKNKGLKMELLFDHKIKGSRFVELDKFQINRVLINLLTNSVKYCTKKPIIKIDLGKDDENLTIKISDNGIGIPNKDKQHIFSKFYRAKNTNFPGAKGLGLGLYFAKRIVEAHQGHILIESSSEKGSLFIISIPLSS